jgi:hypothetical protein
MKMKKCFYFDGREIAGTDITDIPPINAYVILGGFRYIVVYHEFDYDKGEIRVIIIQSNELGVIKEK